MYNYDFFSWIYLHENIKEMCDCWILIFILLVLRPLIFIMSLFWTIRGECSGILSAIFANYVTFTSPKSILISFKIVFGQSHVFPLNPIVNMNKSCNLQCSGNKMHWIVANMMLFHYLHVKLTLLWRTRISGELPLF